MQFFTGDWLKDPAVSMCTPTTRGVWIDFLCAMHERDRCGVIAGTREQLARLGRCPAVHLDHALSELQTSGAAVITEREGIVTVTNRRMQRDAKDRAGNTERQRRHRCNGSVAPKSHPPPESESSSDNPPPPPSVPPVDSGIRKALEEEVFECGVGNARRAVSTALEAGCSPTEIRAVILAWAKRGGDLGAGYLHKRLMELRPGEPPDRGWPKPQLPQPQQSARDKKVEQQTNDALAMQLIKEMRRAGKSDDEIKAALELRGWRWP